MKSIVNFKMKCCGAVAAALLAATPAAMAHVELAPMFTSNMVLQREATVNIHGTARPGSRVTVKPSWCRAVKTQAAADGRWQAALDVPRATGEALSIAITDPDGTVTLDNILAGDVWVCGGQSNMEMPLRGWPGQPAEGTADLIARASKATGVRLYRQPRNWSTTPVDTIHDTRWEMASPAAAGQFSAIGYIFGQYLNDIIDVPVGLIQCCWSNSKIETWMPRESFTAHFPDVQLPQPSDSTFGWLTGTPTLLYNGMVNPWQGFPARGVVWYQGEANNNAGEQYRKLFKVMADDWRRVFANDTLPFYYVQIAPFKSTGNLDTNLAEFRQAQAMIADEVDYSYMVTTGDVGDSTFIHPAAKIPVGQRLARLALECTYGVKGMDAHAPVARSCSWDAEKKRVVIEFSKPASGLYPSRRDLREFEIVDSQGNVYPARAQTDGKHRVWVESPVDDPAQVRYGYHNYFESDLFNGVGVPASPFMLEIKR